MILVCLFVSDAVPDNSRYRSLSFNISQNCVLHGFSGYFDTVLYKNITLSIVPETHSRGMFSWFSIFFPVRVSTFLLYGIFKFVNFVQHEGYSKFPTQEWTDIIIIIIIIIIIVSVVQWSEFLATDPEVPGSIPQRRYCLNNNKHICVKN
jgi:uncharacterized protein with PQ loop repeat